MQTKIKTLIESHIAAAQACLSLDVLLALEYSAKVCQHALNRGNKILLCGNGGSAADAQHIAAELVGRFKKERPGLPAIALTTDTSALTAIGNDYGFDQIFSRQIEAIGREGDVLIAISTSGKSPNIKNAIAAAFMQKLKIIGFTGIKGEMAYQCDYILYAPSEETARIQELHIMYGHILCELLDG